MPHTTINVKGVAIACTDRGEGPPVLMLHGNPDNRHSWKPLQAELGDGYRWIAPDFPGFGESQPLPSDNSLDPEAMAEFWNLFVKEAGIDDDKKVHVVVHDLGGPWLLPWVAKYPERVASVFVLNTMFHKDYEWHSWARIWQTPILGELAMLFANRWLYKREMGVHAPGMPDDFVNDTYSRTSWTMRFSGLRTYRAYAHPEKIFDLWEDRLLAALKSLPVLVLWGDRDPYIPSIYAERFGGTVTHLPEHGHWVHVEAPSLVADQLRPFLSSSEGK